MNIGIVGLGKMGKEIFHLFYDHDYNVTIVDINDGTEFEAKIEKQLSKNLRRQLISTDEYERKRSSFKVTTSLSELKNCDLIIEAIFENVKAKQELFATLESIVSEKCIFVSNTSSIPLNQVFLTCENKERCAGLHFFYPVKITNIVEVNLMKSTAVETKDCLLDILHTVEKRHILFEEQINMFLNKVLCILTTQSYYICKNSNISMEELDLEVKNSMFTFGLFEITDSVGLSIIHESIKNFTDERYETLFTPFLIECANLIRNGYIGGNTKGILDYYKENALSKTSIEPFITTKEEVILSLYSVLFNEIIYTIKNYSVNQSDLIYAISEVLGFEWKNINKKLDYQTYKNTLDKYFHRTSYDMYHSFDEEDFIDIIEEKNENEEK